MSDPYFAKKLASISCREELDAFHAEIQRHRMLTDSELRAIIEKRGDLDRLAKQRKAQQ